jgi:uncharacterized membrane protein
MSRKYSIIASFMTENLILNMNWHKKHKAKETVGDRIADKIASGMGSWTFIIWQTIIVILWMVLNSLAFIYHWDVYPFILLNLIFSTQAAYAAPIIMMSQNRQTERDREHAQHDYEVNLEAKKEIEALQIHLNRVEIEKLDRIIALLEKKG